jgi:hypothetical protein
VIDEAFIGVIDEVTSRSFTAALPMGIDDREPRKSRQFMERKHDMPEPMRLNDRVDAFH